MVLNFSMVVLKKRVYDLGLSEGQITRKNLCHIFQGDFKNLRKKSINKIPKIPKISKKVSKTPKIFEKS